MKRVRLQHLAAIPITNGLGLPGEHDNHEWPRYIRTTDIETPRTLRNDVFASQPPHIAAAAQVKRGDVLASAAGTIGKSVLYQGDAPACYAGFLVRFRANEQTDPRFVSYWMQSAEYWAQIETGAVRSTIDNFSASKYRSLLIPLFALEEQRRIADFLDDRVARIDQIIIARRVQIDASKALEQSRLEASLVHTSDTMIPLRRFGVTVTTGPFGTVFAATDYVRDGVPMVNPTHIKDGVVLPDVDHSVSEETAERLTRHRLREHDLVVSRKGDIGRTAMIGPHQDGWICGSDSIALHANGTKMLPEMLDLLLKLGSVRDQLLAQSNAATMPSLNEGNLLSLKVPAISIDEQMPRVEAARVARQWARSFGSQIDASIDLLTEYKQSLITAAVSGELDVSTAGSGIPG